MLGGEYKHNLDPKNRIFIPAKLRDELGTTFVVTKSLRDKCLKVYSPEEWKKYLEPLEKLDRRLKEELFRGLHASAIEATPDAQGRIVLQKDLIQHAELEKDVVIVGCYNYAEIWSETLYEQTKQNMDFSKLVKELESLGL